MEQIKRLANHTWHMEGNSLSLADVEGKDLVILKYAKINTRYGEAAIMRVREGDDEYNVITSSKRVIGVLEANNEYPTLAKFVKVDGRWCIR